MECVPVQRGLVCWVSVLWAKGLDWWHLVPFRNRVVSASQDPAGAPGTFLPSNSAKAHLHPEPKEQEAVTVGMAGLVWLSLEGPPGATSA